MPWFNHVRFALLGFLSIGLVQAQNESLHFQGASGPGKGKKVVLLAGDEEYRSEESMPMLAKILSQRFGFDCTVLFSVGDNGEIKPDAVKSLSNPSALEQADAIVMALRFRNWPDEVMKKFDDARLAGKSFIALRTSTHAFNISSGVWKKYSYNSKEPDWEGGFGRKILGETWVNHHGRHAFEGTRGLIDDTAKNHPILNGFTSCFGLSDVYGANPPSDAKILLRGQVTKTLEPQSEPVDGAKNNPMQPVAWIRELTNESGKVNRVFCTTMGASIDLEDESLRRLVVNSVFWSLKLDIPEKADVAYVDPFKPSMFKFAGSVPGLKVSDLELGKAFPPAK